MARVAKPAASAVTVTCKARVPDPDPSPMRASLSITMLLASLAWPARAAADPFDDCLTGLRKTAPGRRIDAGTWRLVEGLRPDPVVLAALNAQPEFTMRVWDYLAVMADEERVEDGRRLMKQHQAIFDTVSRKYAVDAAVIAAIWGIESNFGRGTGSVSVLPALATLSCAGRRQSYFRGELFSALRIVQAGHIPADRFRGSWAGAFGQTQFMPSTFWWRAVDFDGDGRRDLMNNIGDALASTANYLKQSGWRAGMPWGVEVRLPGGDEASVFARGEGRRIRRPVATWAARGVTRADGSPLPDASLDASLPVGLFTPAGPRGPAFLVTRNFGVVFSYNGAESYVLAVVHLADRLRGGGSFVTPWPTDDLGLSRADRRELQQRLAARGHDTGAPDAILTPKIIAAVRVEQQRLGVPMTGRPGQQLLLALRAR